MKAFHQAEGVLVMIAGGLKHGDLPNLNPQLLQESLEVCWELAKGLTFDLTSKGQQSELQKFAQLRITKKLFQMFPAEVRDFLIFYNLDARHALFCINPQLSRLVAILDYLKRESPNLLVQNHKASFRGITINTNQTVREDQLQRKHGQGNTKEEDGKMRYIKAVTSQTVRRKQKSTNNRCSQRSKPRQKEDQKNQEKEFK